MLLQNKQRWAWLALRMARDQYLQHFGKIGTGDIILLQQEIENAKLEREKAAAAEAANASMGIAANASPAPPTATDEGAPPAKPSVVKAEGEAATVDGADNAAQPQVQQDAEGDVKMEER